MKCISEFLKGLRSCKFRLIPFLIVIITVVIVWRALDLFNDISHLFPFKTQSEVHHVYLYEMKKTTPDAHDNSLMLLRDHEALAKVEERLATIEKEESDFIDNLRQEYNNQLNILNAWITIWLSLIALLAVILPLAYQYKQRKNDEEKINAEIQRMVEVSRKYDQFYAMVKLQNLVQNWTACHENRMIEGKGSTQLLFHIFSQSVDNFKVLIENVFDKCKHDKEDVYLLSRSLVLMYELVSKSFMINISGTYKREGDKIRSLIRTLFEDLCKNKDFNEDDLYDKFKGLISKLSMLEYTIGKYSEESIVS